MVCCLLQAGGQALTMTALFELTAADGSRALVASRGAALVGLNVDDLELIPNCTSSMAQRFFAGEVLAPWPNRIAGGIWQHEQRELHHPVNDGLGNANHGLVYDQEFEVIERSSSEIKLGFKITPALASVYPFEVQVYVRYKLHTTSLEVEMGATNDGMEPAPFAMGFHPYFAAPEGTTLTLQANLVGLDSVAMIPNRRGAISELGILPPGRPSLVSDLKLDHEFSGFTGTASATLTYPNKRAALIKQDPDLGYLMVFTTEEFPWDAGAAPAIAIEPQSAAIDAFNNGFGLRRLASGESWRAGWTVSVDR